MWWDVGACATPDKTSCSSLSGWTTCSLRAPCLWLSSVPFLGLSTVLTTQRISSTTVVDFFPQSLSDSSHDGYGCVHVNVRVRRYGRHSSPTHSHPADWTVLQDALREILDVILAFRALTVWTPRQAVEQARSQLLLPAPCQAVHLYQKGASACKYVFSPGLSG